MPRVLLVAAALVFLAGLAVRIASLGQPMRQDEADTVVLFALTPLRHILVDTVIPNNHLLHSVLVKGSLAVFGLSAEAARLPAFVAGVAILPLSFLVGRAWYGARAGVMAMAIVAACAPLVLYSTNARGYTLLACATLVAALGVRAGVTRNTRAGWVWWALALAAGAAVNPSMLYPAGGLACWAMLSMRGPDARVRWRSFAAWSVVAGVLALVWYAPAIKVSGWQSIVSNDYVKPMAWGPFVSALGAFAGDFGAWVAAGWVAPWTVLAVVGLLAGWVTHRSSPNDRVALSLVMLGFAVLLLIAMRRAPFLRVWLFLLPPLAVSVGAGLDRFLARLPRADVAAAVLAVLVAAGNAAMLAQRDVVAQMPDTGLIPDAPHVATELARQLAPGDGVAAMWRTQGPVDFYLRQRDINASFVSDGGRAPARLYVVTSTALQETAGSVLASRRVTGADSTTATLVAAFPTATLWRVERRAAP